MMIKLAASTMLALAALAYGGGSPLSVESSIVPHPSDSYVSPATAWIDPAIVRPGGRSVIRFSAGFFAPHEAVTAAVSGVYAEGARLSSSAAFADPALSSNADGSLTAFFVAPPKGRGPYAITFTGSRGYVAVVTVVGARRETSAATRTHPYLPEHVPTLEDLSSPTAPSENTAPGADSTPAPTPESPAPPDREGRVDIPGALPQAPAWPGPGEVPLSLVLLGGIAIVAGLVTAGLAVAARRRR